MIIMKNQVFYAHVSMGRFSLLENRPSLASPPLPLVIFSTKLFFEPFPYLLFSGFPFYPPPEIFSPGSLYMMM